MTGKLSNEHFVVFIPDVRQPVPLFILMRALGVVSDKDIIRYCLLDIEKNVGFFIKANRNIETEKSTENFVDFEKYNYNAGKFVSDSGVSVIDVC